MIKKWKKGNHYYYFIFWLWKKCKCQPLDSCLWRKLLKKIIKYIIWYKCAKCIKWSRPCKQPTSTIQCFWLVIYANCTWRAEPGQGCFLKTKHDLKILCWEQGSQDYNKEQQHTLGNWNSQQDPGHKTFWWPADLAESLEYKLDSSRP